MKNLLFLLLGIIILVSSCSISYRDAEVDNPKEVTTVEIQESVIDSCAIIAELDESIYILNENLEVTHELSGIIDDYSIIHDGWLCFSLVWFIFSIIIFIALLLE